LRLLAREVYEKVVKRVGKLKVALITGEEQIVPRGAKYYISTVEAMPNSLSVDFVAVDEIQLCNDYERGHIFTDRLLYSRGDIETVFLGSSSMQNLVSTLFPKSTIIQKERRSKIIYEGKKNLFSLPKRTAIIAFNINSLYNIAAKIKAVKGGAAIVMGALSPHTRNAQVSMFEEGIVDYIVATDAIGMGLNLDIDHVAISSRKKFDGRHFRFLTESELAQIVGRAGRNTKKGTFGVTLDCLGLDSVTVSSIEQHRFKPINYLYWRNKNLDFSTLTSLVRSLESNSNSHFLIKNQNTEDENLLKYLSSIKTVEQKLNDPQSIKLLWEISTIPDYLKNFGHSFSDILIKIFCDISSTGKINSNWVLKELKSLHSNESSIEILTYKLAKTRFWNFLSNKNHWLDKSTDIKNFAQQTERRLSEFLHKRLIEEFVDYKLKSYINDYKLSSNSEVTISKGCEIYLDKKKIGEKIGLKVNIYDKASIFKNKNLKDIITSKIKVLVEEYIKKIVKENNVNMSINDCFEILIDNVKIGSLYRGKNLYSPNILIESSEYVEKSLSNKFTEKINKIVSVFINSCFSLKNDSLNNNFLRSLFFSIKEEFGFVEKIRFTDELKKLNYEERILLKKNRIKIGKVFIYDTKIFSSKLSYYRRILAKVFFYNKNFSTFPKKDVLVNVKNIDINFLRTIGYVKIKDIAVNIILIESFLNKLMLFPKTVYIINYCHYREFNLDYLNFCKVMEYLGFLKITGTEVVNYWRKRYLKKEKKSVYDKNSPFYMLKKLQ